MSYTTTGTGRTHLLAPPSFEIDGTARSFASATWKQIGHPLPLANGAVEHTFRGRLEEGLSLVLTLRVADDSPVIRFRYTLESDRLRHLTKSNGRDAVEYTTLSLASLPDAAELRLSEFVVMVHTYVPNEVPLAPKEFAASEKAVGPILLAGDSNHQVLIAYEHGSTYPDAYLQYLLSPDRTVALRAVKGNYLNNQEI
ncbi:MAG TPA: hypothetical protein VGB55_08100, partial [Tepidisphaeraceae bacterium]